MRLIKNYLPALVATALTFIILIQTYNAALTLNNGKFIYALDDAYIHMSMAKHLVRDGVWGVTPYGFTSASSSPLWTGSLALTYFIFGVNEYSPLIMNLVFACALLFVINFILLRHQVPPLYIGLALILLLVLWQVDRQILMGMEHILQPLMNLIFVYYAARVLSQHQGTIHHTPTAFLGELPRSKETLFLLILSMLVGLARYEGLLLVLVFCGLFALRGRLLYAIILGVVSITPIILYGLISIGNGWGILPSSVQLNSNGSFFAASPLADIVLYMTRGTFEAVMNIPTMIGTLAAAALVFLFRYDKQRLLWDSATIMLVSLAFLIFFHTRLVNPEGTHLRYASYLIPFGLTIIFAGLGLYLPRRFTLQAAPLYAASVILALLLIQPWFNRSIVLNTHVPVARSMNNIYEQQYQMAQFFKTYYSGEAVGANDIGAINYFADIRNIDLWGLGTWDVTQARSKNQYNTDAIRQIMQKYGGRVAILYDYWFNDLFGGVPPEWIVVGQWGVIPANSAILGGHTVTFYAVNEDEARILAENLRDFAPQLPETVIQSGAYMEEIAQTP